MSRHRKLSLDIVVPSDRLCFPKYSALGWGDLLEWNIAESRTDLELESAPHNKRGL